MLWILGIPLALIAVAFLYWQLRYPTHTYRYKLTVEVDTPEGVRSGCAVREVTWRDGISFAEGSTGFTKERGEAVAVDLPAGETLFALLSSNIQGKTAGLAFGHINQTMKSSREVVEVQRPERLSPVWGQDGYPRFVRFRDLADPMSVQKIDLDDLASTFGEGYAIKCITAQITDENVTAEISSRVSWLEELDDFEFRKDGPFYKKFPSAASGLRRK